MYQKQITKWCELCRFLLKQFRVNNIKQNVFNISHKSFQKSEPKNKTKQKKILIWGEIFSYLCNKLHNEILNCENIFYYRRNFFLSYLKQKLVCIFIINKINDVFWKITIEKSSTIP